MEEYYTTEECAAILKVSPKTLETWRSRGKGPKYYKVGGRVLYKKSDIEAFIEGSLVRKRCDLVAIHV